MAQCKSCNADYIIIVRKGNPSPQNPLNPLNLLNPHPKGETTHYDLCVAVAPSNHVRCARRRRVQGPSILRTFFVQPFYATRLRQQATTFFSEPSISPLCYNISHQEDIYETA